MQNIFLGFSVSNDVYCHRFVIRQTIEKNKVSL